MKFDYAIWLERRARHALSRDKVEGLETVIDGRNRACLEAWHRRWHQRAAHPDAWEDRGRARQFFDLFLRLKREKARAWIERQQAARIAVAPRNVLVLKQKRRPVNGNGR